MKAILKLVLPLILILFILGGYYLIKENFVINEDIVYNFYSYKSDLSGFATYNYQGRYLILDNYSDYYNYYVFLENIFKNIPAPYREDYFLDNKLVLLDNYQECNQEIVRVYTKKDTLYIETKKEINSCLKNEGIMTFFEVSKKIKKVDIS